MKAAAVFGDNSVLQRRRPVRIFGSCGSEQGDILVKIPELGVSAKALVSGGKWEAVLPPMEACEGCSLEIVSGAIKQRFSNVAIGEVWLAGGQSNMEFELRSELRGAEALSSCEGENVRYYYTPKVAVAGEELAEAERRSGWSLPSAENSKAWSAVGYYFARELSRRLGVTVGVIGCNWGGTSASAWVSRETLSRDERLRAYLEDGFAPDDPMRPCGLYETMIKRVAPYTIAGIIYYQGESDSHRPEVYAPLMKALIDLWRADWRDPELPFLAVQLPGHRYASEPDYKNWAEIREAQYEVYRTVRNSGLAVAIDCGEFNDIHPKEKARVAHRLYLQALREVYSLADESEASPPFFRFAVPGEGGVRLYFENCSGFEARGELSCFETAGSDRVYVPAKAEIDGDTILLTADVPLPITGVRCLWSNYPEVSLYGSNGLPVPPFRCELPPLK